MCNCDESDRIEFGLERDRCAIERSPCGTHPGTERGTVCGSLMMGMVSGVLDRLGLCQSTDGQDTEYQEDRAKFQFGAVHHHEDPVELNKS